MLRFGIFFIILSFSSLFGVSQTKLIYNDKNFSFVLSIDSTLTPDSVNYDCTVKSITITRLKDNKQLQVLKPEESAPSCGLPKDQVFIIEDVNFDGVNDIRLLQFLPAAPNLPYYYWTYDSKTQKFVRQKSLEDITSPEFDHKRKLIFSFWRDGCCNHGLSTYKYINGKPILIEESEVKTDDNNNITTIKRLVNGKMKLIKRTVEKNSDN